MHTLNKGKVAKKCKNFQTAKVKFNKGQNTLKIKKMVTLEGTPILYLSLKKVS